MNDHMVMVAGKSATGKSMCLKDITNPEGVMYLNCEGKKLPFKSKFMEFMITDPYQVNEAFTEAENMPEIHTIVVDSLTFLMDMFETMYVITAADGRKAWGDYAVFFKTLMNQEAAKSTKTVIFTAHTADIMNDAESVMETMVKVKGSLMNNGIESFFSTVIATKRMPIKALKDYSSDMLNISDKENRLKFKYCFQTDLTDKTVNERIRGPFLMWDECETYIDNNLQHIIDRLNEFYGE